MASNNLQVLITSTAKVLWEGEASSVSSTNSQGPFDILPMHSNFISVVDNHPIIVRPVKGEKQTYSFPFSVIYAYSNTVEVYTNVE